MCFARLPNGHANPGKSREDHVNDGAIYENLKRAVPIAKLPKEQAEYAIVRTEKQPRDQAGGQQVAGHEQKSKNGNQREEAEEHDRSDIALQCQALQHWETIGNEQPSSENQNQANAGVDTNSNRHVAENVEPTVTG